MPRRFVTQDYKINNKIIEIYNDEAKHIQVTRNNINDVIEVNEYVCKIISIEKNSITCEIIGQAKKVGIPNTKITLYQALLKSDKMEYVIQKSVELGVTKIVPFVSKNVVVKLDKKDVNKKIDRWNKISLEAVKQCGRSDTVEVFNVLEFNEMLNSLLSFDKIIIAYENEKEPLKNVIMNLNSNDKIAIIIGSEGGFESKEVEEVLKNKNAISVSLGTRILRAETASLNLLSILMYELEN